MAPPIRDESTYACTATRPTQEGIPLAKDVFMLGIAGTLILDSLTSRARRKVKKALKS